MGEDGKDRPGCGPGSQTEAISWQGCGEMPVRQVTESLLGQMIRSNVTTNTYHDLLACLFLSARNLNRGQEALSAAEKWIKREMSIFPINSLFVLFGFSSILLLINFFEIKFF